MDDLDKLIKRLGKLSGKAAVGTFTEEASMKLAFAEFGTRTAPPRPVLSATTDSSAGSIDRAIANQVGQVLDGAERTGDEIMGKVGQDLRELVVEQIQGGLPKPLKPATLRGRRARGNTDTRPLIDRTLLEPGERALVDSIEVKVGADAEGDD